MKGMFASYKQYHISSFFRLPKMIMNSILITKMNIVLNVKPREHKTFIDLHSQKTISAPQLAS